MSYQEKRTVVSIAFSVKIGEVFGYEVSGQAGFCPGTEGGICMKKKARIVGTLFLIAMAASLTGGSIVNSVPVSSPVLLIGVFLELLNAASVVGIAALMFPILKKQNKSMATGYLVFRLIEAAFCALITAAPLAVMVGAGASAGLGVLRSAAVDLLIPLFFCAGALLFYYLLYKSSLIPRFISGWGILAAISILMMNLLPVFQLLDSEGISMALALPIIVNEVFLGIWLIVKGFKPTPTPPSRL